MRQFGDAEITRANPHRRLPQVAPIRLGTSGDGGWIGAVLLGKSKASYHGRYSDTRQSCANH